jgi:hypothetical protein
MRKQKVGVVRSAPALQGCFECPTHTETLTRRR